MTTTSLPTPVQTFEELREILGRFLYMMDADSKAQFAAAIATVEARGMPVGDTDFNTLTATDEMDLLVKLQTRMAALLRDVPAGAPLQTVALAAQPIMPLMNVVTSTMTEVMFGVGPAWPITFSVQA
jgi:hypothetical protein